MRRILSDYNADREDLFSAAGTGYLKQVAVSDSHRFVLDQLLASWLAYQAQLDQTTRKLRAFARRLLCMMTAMLQDGRPYRYAGAS